MEILTSTYIIDLLGLAQGGILGLVLVLANKTGRPTLLLGLFLFTYTIEILPSLLNDMGLTGQYHALIWLPLHFYFLSMPLLFLYVLQLTGELNWKQHWRHLIPGLIEFITLGTFFLLEAGGTNRLFSIELAGTLLSAHFFAGLIFNLFYARLTLLRLKEHRKHLLEVHSNLAGKWLGWLSVGIYLLIAFIVVLLVLEVAPPLLRERTEYLLITSLNVVLIYYLAVNGIRQLSFTMPQTKAETEAELTTSLGDGAQVQGADERATVIGAGQPGPLPFVNFSN